MKILYDLTATQPNWNAKMHGGGNYGISVFLALLNKHADMECAWDSSRFLSPTVAKACKENDVVMHDVHQNDVEDILSHGNFGVYYSALMSDVGDKVDGVRYLATCHGLRGTEMPADKWALKYKLPFKWRVRELIRVLFPNLLRARQVRKDTPFFKDNDIKFVVASNHTKYSVLSYYPFLNPENIHVCWSPSTSREWHGKAYSDQKYIFLVSGNRSEKNALRALKALDELFSERPSLTKDLQVNIAGARRSDYRVKFINEEHFNFLGYVDDDTLNALYCGAWLFVYPSLNEGFGYPPVEAMRFGVPVIASPISSISEVCQDAAMYFNPFDYHELKGRIFRMLDDKDCYNEYKSRSIRRYEEVTKKQNDDLDKLCQWIMNGGELSVGR